MRVCTNCGVVIKHSRVISVTVRNTPSNLCARCVNDGFSLCTECGKVYEGKCSCTRTRFEKWLGLPAR